MHSAIVPTNMNVAVVGSFDKKLNGRLLGEKEQFATACRALGKKLAEWGHRLVVPHALQEGTAEKHALEGFQEAAPYHYFSIIEHKGDPVLKAHFEAVEKSDAVILLGGLNGTYAAGLTALRGRKLILPIPGFGGSAKDLCEIREIDKMLVDEIRNLRIGSDEKWIETLVDAARKFLNAFPRALIIHGRGDSGAELKEKIIEASEDRRSPLQGIENPVIMNLTGMGALTVPDVFESLASQVSAAIAIVTADDVGGFARGEGKEFSARELRLSARARENVWVEVGWFWGRLGRERVFLWLKDHVELPSDLQGTAWTRSMDIDGAWKSVEAFMIQLRSPKPPQVAREAPTYSNDEDDRLGDGPDKQVGPEGNRTAKAQNPSKIAPHPRKTNRGRLQKSHTRAA